MVPGAHVFLVSVAPFTAVRLCVFALSAVHGWRGGGGAHWGVGQLADRPAVNREVGGSSPPAPAGHRSRSSDACHRISRRCRIALIRTSWCAAIATAAYARHAVCRPGRGARRIASRSWRLYSCDPRGRTGQSGHTAAVARLDNPLAGQRSLPRTAPLTVTPSGTPLSFRLAPLMTLGSATPSPSQS